MQPPSGATWQSRTVTVSAQQLSAFVSDFPDPLTAQNYAWENWEPTQRANSAIFQRQLPVLLGEPIGFTPTGFPMYDPPLPKQEMWFLPNVSFATVWEFAKTLGFVPPELQKDVLKECDAFLADLSKRHPIGLVMVSETSAVFRRVNDGARFSAAEMRRACDLNVLVLGQRQDETHSDPGMSQHFVKKGFFTLGV